MASRFAFLSCRLDSSSVLCLAAFWASSSSCHRLVVEGRKCVLEPNSKECWNRTRLYHGTKLISYLGIPSKCSLVMENSSRACQRVAELCSKTRFARLYGSQRAMKLSHLCNPCNLYDILCSPCCTLYGPDVSRCLTFREQSMEWGKKARINEKFREDCM